MDAVDVVVVPSAMTMPIQQARRIAQSRVVNPVAIHALKGAMKDATNAARIATVVLKRVHAMSPTPSRRPTRRTVLQKPRTAPTQTKALPQASQAFAQTAPSHVKNAPVTAMVVSAARVAIVQNKVIAKTAPCVMRRRHR